MKSLLVKLGIILIGLAIFGDVEVWGANWKYFGAGGNATFWWYDAEAVTYHPDRTIHVWVKKIKADDIEGMAKSGARITASELEQMTLERDYERSFIEIDCAEKTVKFLQKLNYDSKGILKGGESKSGAKENIPTDSVAEALYRAVCK